MNNTIRSRFWLRFIGIILLLIGGFVCLNDFTTDCACVIGRTSRNENGEIKLDANGQPLWEINPHYLEHKQKLDRAMFPLKLGGLILSATGIVLLLKDARLRRQAKEALKKPSDF
jgi:hypothetical protein